MDCCATGASLALPLFPFGLYLTPRVEHLGALRCQAAIQRPV
ncbi:hypothetical protein SPWS13_3937 [Shewanella putrefaciens]|nr:hypothetical protein SPWS13_3937 [Shewanella putrefaciens]